MNAIVKLSLITICIVAFIGIVCIALIDSLAVQSICLMGVLILNLVRFSCKELYHEIKLFLPFIFTMLVVYVILGFTGYNPGSVSLKETAGLPNGFLYQYPVMAYWLHYGFTRSLLFISTMLFIQLMLSGISLDDLLALPFSIHKKKAVILGKALFIAAVRSVGDLEFHLKLLPHYQKKSLSIKQWFRFKLTLSLALILMLLRESKQKGELIDNRIKHCFLHTISSSGSIQ